MNWRSRVTADKYENLNLLSSKTRTSQSSLARDSDADEQDKCLLPSVSGRGCQEFEPSAELLGSLLGEGSKTPLKTAAAQTQMGETRLSEHGWRRLSDLYEPYLLLRRCPGTQMPPRCVSVKCQRLALTCAMLLRARKFVWTVAHRMQEENSAYVIGSSTPQNPNLPSSLQISGSKHRSG